jgi:N-acetylmuramoyl-L-alanine amidase
MNFNKLLKLFFSGYLLLSICYLLSGCASAPSKVASSTYNINGAAYLALVTLCDAKAIDWRYDTYTRAVYLNKDTHRVNLRVGDKMVMVDGRPVHFNHPVEIYKGTVVVPYKFKEQVIDQLFRDTYQVPQGKPAVLRIKKIVVDAGHGGHDPGAIGKSGLREKDVNLDIARRLSNLLRSRGVEVLMTRAVDKFIPLSRRVDIANNSRADLFISIHSNANRVRSLNGFEVYYVSPTAGDSTRAYSTARSVPLNLANCSFASNSLDLKAILWDMFYTHSRGESVELSRRICWSMDKNLDARLLGIKGARFEVLKGVRMPAVLVEVGFLSNSSEERMLKNGFYRQKVAECLVQGIDDYTKTLPLMEVVKR